MTTVTSGGKWTDKPVDSRIFGGFIESGFGRQIDGMWSEMIYNRAFRRIPAYTQATWDWLGLDAAHYNDSAPFWHSGYEENDWQSFGDVKLRHTLGTRTYKGQTSLMVEVSAGCSGGVRQKGIRLRSGQNYDFEIMCSMNGNLADPGLNGFDNPLFSPESTAIEVKIGAQSRVFEVLTSAEKQRWHFTAKETEHAEIGIEAPAGSSLILSFVSLMPSDNVLGWRRDVVALLKELKPGVVRFPGGCFVSFYDWLGTVGSRDRREPLPSFYWGGLEENDVGVDEFMCLSELAGFEAQFCINMMTSYPFHARQLVEYLNADENTGMGRLRACNGHPASYGVRLFEMDNEPGRKWTAKAYAEQCVDFAREMRLAGPKTKIELMLAAYSYAPEDLMGMLEIAGNDIEYVIYRNGSPEFVKAALGVIREFNRKSGRDIRLVNTEWLPSCHSPEPFEDPEIPTNFRWRGMVTNDYKNIFSTQQRSWNYALNGAHRLLDYMSYGGEFSLANFNNMCNTWGQNLIEASLEKAWLSCAGEVFAFFARHFKPCTASALQSDNPLIHAVETRQEDGGTCLFVINHGSGDEAVSMSKVIAKDAIAEGGSWMLRETISCDTRLEACTEAGSAVKRFVPSAAGFAGPLPGLSISVFEGQCG